MSCCICSAAEACIGVLCDGCRDELIGPVAITNEQIRIARGAPSPAALVDVWGVTHRVASSAIIGRTLEPGILAIFDASISRRHARLEHGPAGWTIEDLGSANGTFVDDRAVTSPQVIADRARVRLGFISFFFVADASALAIPLLAPMAQTARPGAPLQPPAELRVRLVEPSGGGGGVAEIDGIAVQLTLAQYELMSQLVARMTATAHDPDDRRGFVSVSELAGVLSLDSNRPDEDHVRHLVRRVRRAMLKAGVGNVIESRYGLGYRLTRFRRSA